jgi:hypothetical protein
MFLILKVPGIEKKDKKYETKTSRLRAWYPIACLFSRQANLVF